MTGVSSSFDEFMHEMEDEARQAGPEAEAAFFESQQRHWIGRRRRGVRQGIWRAWGA